jgi:N6-L-threonylcarbamoyladenine synthase
MTILGIETSCDETSASLVKINTNNAKVQLISNVIASSLALHAKTGGIIPEVAAREQVKYILPVIQEAIKDIKNPQKEIDAIAVTTGPGLIGSLLVGVETARTFAYVWDKPIYSVNHLFGHIYANFINQNSKSDDEIKFPSIALIVSGGHTDLVLIKNHKQTKWLGGTRDDAAGEALDKTGRILGLTYPAGPQIEKLAQKIKTDKYNFPRPLINSKDFDFSFSGLKTAVLREVQASGKLDNQTTSDICFSLQEAVFDVLIKKTLTAANKYNVKSILLGGGVAANQTLRDRLKASIDNSKSSIKLFVPPKSLCTDNAAMIAAAGFFNYEPTTWPKVSANPEAYFD